MNSPSIRGSHRRIAVLVAALIMFASVQPAAALTFRVRGNGHGLGMSQWGAKGFADAGYDYQTILRHYYSGTQVVLWPSAEPARDVRIDPLSNSTNGAYTKATWTIRPGNPGAQLVIAQDGQAEVVTGDSWSTFTASGDTITWVGSDARTKTYSGTIRVFERGATGVSLTQVRERTGGVQLQSNPVILGWDHARYRGELRLTARTGAIKLINRVSMRDYLYGVVPRESPASWHMEALKAQAVAARAYSWNPSLTNSALELWSTTSDQVYAGHSHGENRVSSESHEHPRTNSAVDQTQRVVVTHDGKMIRTYFSAASGGYTEDNEKVWSGTALPYLRGVPDPYEIVAGTSRHTWSELTTSTVAARDRLRAVGLTVPTDLTDINVVGRGVSGRVTRIELVSAGGVKSYIEGSTNLDKFKSAFGWGSRWFVVDPKTYRIAGDDRYHTSVQASLQAFGPSAASPARVAVVVGGFAEPDALAAAGVAGAAGGGPVLLTPGGSLDSRVRAEIDRLNVSTVYIVGGTGAVSPAVETAIRSISGVATVRLGGADRYETAARVTAEIKRLKGQPARAVVVSGESIVDGVVASNLAYAKSLPVILVRAGTIPASSATALSGVTTSLVVGGTGVISDAVAASLPDARRIAPGLSRYHTAALLGDYLVGNEGFAWNRCYVASGTSLADVLSIGPTAGTSMHPVLLAETYSMPAPTRDRLVTKKPSLGAVWLAGGEGALSGWAQTQVEAALE